MKYKIKKISRKRHNAEKPIEFSSAFDYGIFCEWTESLPVPYRKKRSKLSRTLRRLRVVALLRFYKARKRLAEKLARFRARPEDKVMLPALCGALCAAAIFMLVCFGVAAYSLVLKNYFGMYKTVTVPDFAGASYPNDAIFSDSDYCNFNISYEYSSDVPEGEVILQSPEPNVTRRVYSNRSLCNVDLVVSLGKQKYSIPDFRDLPLREALLELKNAGVKFSISEKYSDTVPKGKIISSSPPPDTTFTADQTVTLVLSLGVKDKYATVPKLLGLTESRATALLTEAGFTIGKISYVNSELPYGTVIFQSHTAYSFAKQGESISLSVSAGIKFTEKKIPNLHGLSIAEAKSRLSEVGLVVGNIYAVANAAPQGTVVAQSILPETPITSDIYSVDIYVSS